MTEFYYNCHTSIVLVYIPWMPMYQAKCENITRENPKTIHYNSIHVIYFIKRVIYTTCYTRQRKIA